MLLNRDMEQVCNLNPAGEKPLPGSLYTQQHICSDIGSKSRVDVYIPGSKLPNLAENSPRLPNAESKLRRWPNCDSAGYIGLRRFSRIVFCFWIPTYGIILSRVLSYLWQGLTNRWLFVVRLTQSCVHVALLWIVKPKGSICRHCFLVEADAVFWLCKT